MSSTTKNAKHLSIILVVTLLTLNLPCVTLVNVAHAAPGKTPKSIKAEKVSSFLKSNTHTPDERVTVIVTLSGPIKLQLTLCGIFQDLLGIDQIGIYDNFFELGGNSLVALQFTNRLRKVFELELPAVNLFRAATVVELSAEMRNEDAADPPARSPAIAPIPREIQRIQRSADDELVLQGEMT